MLQVAYSPIYQHPLPAGHRFPMLKYELIPKQLIYEGIIESHQLFEPNAVEDEIILQTHTEKYLTQLNALTLQTAHIRRIGFPLSAELILREKILVQGTIDCALNALQFGVSLNVAGGTHHAFADKGEGFCILNDLAIAANYLLNKGLVKKILIIDLDVHQGNGTASIFMDEPRVITFSMHGSDNYPFFKEQSTLDVPLVNGIEDEAYLLLLEIHLSKLLVEHKPDFLFYQCGVDVLATDALGKLKLSELGCKKRDEIVFRMAKKLKLPIACAMGGGYSPKISDIVNAHCQTFKLANQIFF